jgi:hypothetical protein
MKDITSNHEICINRKPINQCDGCMAGIPIDENGRHRMGKPHSYPDYMVCEKSRYQNKEK